MMLKMKRIIPIFFFGTGMVLVCLYTNSSWYLTDNILPLDLYHNRPIDPVNAHAGISDANDSVPVACQFPNFDPFHPDAMKFYEKHPTFTCKGMTTLTYYDGEAVRVNETLKRLKHGKKEINCWYREVSFLRGFKFMHGSWIGPFTQYMLVEKRPEFVEVLCSSREGQEVSRMHHYITREEYRRRSKPTPSAALRESQLNVAFQEEQLNVILLSTDSVSRYLFKRAMLKTRQFLLDTMNAVEMNKYNRVGSSSFPNLLAMLVGIYQHEPRHWSIAQGFDDLTFLWDEYKAAGYRTQYVSDNFDFRKFRKPPTDSFNFPMLQSIIANKDPFDNDCFEDKVEVKLWLDLILEFIKDSVFANKKFFSFGMIMRPTHDFANKASAVDEFYTNFFQELYEKNILNNTFVIFFGDHGPRTRSYRYTTLGSIEERSANMVIYVPPWFKKKYPVHYRNLIINKDRLTTNFDIYKTVKALLKLDGKNHQRQTNHIKKSDRLPRGICLFTEIPPERTCEDAEIDAHNCMCHGGMGVTNLKLMREVADEAVREINSVLSPVSSVCARLHLKEVKSLVMLQGYLGWTATYRVMISTVPGNAAFEATVKYTVTAVFFKSLRTVGHVSRINLYRGQSDCVDDHILQRYCYCKDLLQP